MRHATSQSFWLYSFPSKSFNKTFLGVQGKHANLDRLHAHSHSQSHSSWLSSIILWCDPCTNVWLTRQKQNFSGIPKFLYEIRRVDLSQLARRSHRLSPLRHEKTTPVLLLYPCSLSYCISPPCGLEEFLPNRRETLSADVPKNLCPQQHGTMAFYSNFEWAPQIETRAFRKRSHSGIPSVCSALSLSSKLIITPSSRRAVPLPYNQKVWVSCSASSIASLLSPFRHFTVGSLCQHVSAPTSKRQIKGFENGGPCLSSSCVWLSSPSLLSRELSLLGPSCFAGQVDFAKLLLTFPFFPFMSQLSLDAKFGSACGDVTDGANN